VLRRGASFALSGLLLWGCAALPPSRGAGSTRMVTCITRTLSGGTRLQVLSDRFEIADPALISFLDTHPRLDGRILLSDLLFLERLADSPCRALLSTRTEALREEVGKRLEALAADPPAASASLDGTWKDVLAGLDPAKLCKVSFLLDSLEDDSFLASVSASIEADARDRSSEHGGLVLVEGGDACKIRLLEVPSASEGDHDFVLPPELFTAGALAFWHNHAFNDLGVPWEELDNSGSMMPSGSLSGSLATVWGDKWAGYIRGIDGLVFTPTGGRTFAVVYVTSDGVTIYLGRYLPR
jgi:hypothetical protein